MPKNLDEQFKSTCRDFLTYDVLKKTFISLAYIDFMQIEGLVKIHCTSLEQTLMHVAAYHYFFDSTIKADIEFKLLENNDKKLNHPGLPFYGYEWFRNKFKKTINKKDQICTSIINVKNHEKGVMKKQKEDLLSCFGSKVIDLGDSRNFVNEDQLIDKLTILAESKCFLGSSTSYSHMAPMFNTPSIHINSFWPYNGERLWTREFVCDTVNGDPIGYEKV